MNEYAVDRLVRDRIAELHSAADRQRVVRTARRARRWARRIREGSAMTHAGTHVPGRVGA